MELQTVLFLKIEAPNYSSAAIQQSFIDNGYEVEAINWQHDRFNYGMDGLKEITLARVRNLQPKPPDIVFIHVNTPTPAHHPSLLDIEFIKELRKYSFVVNYTFDVRENIDCHINIAPHTDLILFSNMTDVKKMRALGYDNVDYMQVSADYNLFSKGAHSISVPDIVFIGNNFAPSNLNFPLAADRKEMVDFLYKNYPKDFKAYGMGWHTKIINTPEDQRELYNGCKIAISHNQFDYECYTSDRLFRIMACGTFCITKHFEGIETMFNVGEHLVTYRTLDELKYKIDYYLQLPDERQKIADAGYLHVRENHTWFKRIEKLKEIVDGINRKKEEKAL